MHYIRWSSYISTDCELRGVSFWSLIVQVSLSDDYWCHGDILSSSWRQYSFAKVPQVYQITHDWVTFLGHDISVTKPASFIGDKKREVHDHRGTPKIRIHSEILLNAKIFPWPWNTRSIIIDPSLVSGPTNNSMVTKCYASEIGYKILNQAIPNTSIFWL